MLLLLPLDTLPAQYVGVGIAFVVTIVCSKLLQGILPESIHSPRCRFLTAAMLFIPIVANISITVACDVALTTYFCAPDCILIWPQQKRKQQESDMHQPPADTVAEASDEAMIDSGDPDGNFYQRLQAAAASECIHRKAPWLYLGMEMAPGILEPCPNKLFSSACPENKNDSEPSGKKRSRCTTNTGGKRKHEGIENKFSNSFFITLETWKRKRHSIADVAVCYACDVVGCEHGPNRRVKLSVSVKLWVEASPIEQTVLQVRDDKLEKFGLPYPWDLYFNLVLNAAAKSQGAASGFEITFKGTNRNGNGSEQLGHHIIATFQFDDVFIDAGHVSPYTVSMLVSNVLRGDKIAPGDATFFKKYAARELHFTGAFFDALGPGRWEAAFPIMDKERDEMRIRARKETVADEQRMCDAVAAVVPYYRRLHKIFSDGQIPDYYFNTASELKRILKEPHVDLWKDSICAFVNGKNLRCLLQCEFSGYRARGRDICNDDGLLVSLCIARTGSAGERCEAAEHLDISRSHAAIKFEDIDSYEYTDEFYAVFANFCHHSPVNRRYVLSRLDRSSLETYDETFDKAVAKQFGPWPFAYGVMPRAGIEMFASIFADASKIYIASPYTAPAHLEATFLAMKQCSDAYDRHHVRGVRARYLKEAGATERELNTFWQHAALEEQIGGGFNSIADSERRFGPDFLSNACASVPRLWRPKSDRLPAPPCIGAISNWDGEIDSDDGDEENTHSDTDFEDANPEGERIFNRERIEASLVKGVPRCFKKLPLKTLRDIRDLAKTEFAGTYENVQIVVRAIMRRLPAGADPDAKTNVLTRHSRPLWWLNRVGSDCEALLGYRAFKFDQSACQFVTRLDRSCIRRAFLAWQSSRLATISVHMTNKFEA